MHISKHSQQKLAHLRAVGTSTRADACACAGVPQPRLFEFTSLALLPLREQVLLERPARCSPQSSCDKDWGEKHKHTRSDNVVVAVAERRQHAVAGRHRSSQSLKEHTMTSHLGGQSGQDVCCKKESYKACPGAKLIGSGTGGDVISIGSSLMGSIWSSSECQSSPANSALHMPLSFRSLRVVSRPRQMRPHVDPPPAPHY